MPGLLDNVGRLLNYRIPIGELIGLGLFLAAPYLSIGLIWSLTHTAALHGMRGLDLVVSLLGSIVAWPVLLIANVCMQ
ncbi:hypothetical protein [Mycolicibacter icosiumassiliensis]|uniref:hypothetical protein n=1 Tax=Mycolicibacter icosiumassiliensis TaxID=1792835 RepID=UPI00082B99FE|nr:hypothetical protein [Mycolicibacter icosiumassiliensis]